MLIAFHTNLRVDPEFRHYMHLCRCLRSAVFKNEGLKWIMHSTLLADGGRNQGPVACLRMMCFRLGWTIRDEGWTVNGSEQFCFWDVDPGALEDMIHDALWIKLSEDVSRRKYMAYLSQGVVPLTVAIQAIAKVNPDLRPYAVGVLSGACRWTTKQLNLEKTATCLDCQAQ